MQQLKEVKEILAPYQPEVLLVADAMTGQEAVNVAKVFHESVTLTGVVLSKMDSDAKGGAALSIRHVTGVPIKYISMGEKMKDLELFHPDRLAGRILDMGDVVTLVEKAQESIDEHEAERMMKNMEKGQFTIEDFLKQMEMFSNLGPMTSVLKMLPGMGDMLRQVGDLSPAEKEMKKIRVMIQSMTPAERKNHRLIKGARLERIAKGSGNPASALEDFLKKFVQMERMIGPLMQMMKGGMPMPGGQGPMGFPGMPDAGKQKKKYKSPWGGGFFS
jgi:signal recognition particle subunit SRP54